MSRAPSLVPEAFDRDIYLVFDNLGGCLGRAWRETQEGRTDRVTVIRDLLEGHYRSLGSHYRLQPRRRLVARRYQ